MTCRDRFERDGFFVLEAILPPALSTELFQEVLAAFSDSSWSHTIEGTFRAHCPLKLTPSVKSAIELALHQGHEAIDPFLFRRKLLVELSSITVFPNARAQEMHSDEQDPDKRVVTVFLNLFPTAEETGPLCVIPGSHRFTESVTAMPRLLLLPAGSAVFMNGKLRHAGLENRSVDRIRPVVYASFGDDDAVGPTYSIRPEYLRRFSLADFRQAAPAKSSTAEQGNA